MTGPAVLLMAYGSPDRLADVPAYYSDIRGGRPIRPELDVQGLSRYSADLVARYRALGIDDGDGPSPLNSITEETRAALEAVLGIPVLTGMRHWDPRISAAVDAALAVGNAPILGLVLAPHWSSLSIAKYEGLFDQAVAGRAETRFVRSWSDDPGFIALLDEGDTYRDTLLETSRLVAGAAGVGDWSFAFQSESRTGEPWLGPDILDHLSDLSAQGVADVLVCPVGFVSDHLEIRWDIDVEAVELAHELGLELTRIEMPNDEPAFVRTLATIVRRTLGVPSPA